MNIDAPLGSVLIGQRIAFSSGSSSFENILGISTIDITVKNRHSATGDGYPFEASSLDNNMNAKTYLKFEPTPKIQIEKGLLHSFL